MSTVKNCHKALACSALLFLAGLAGKTAQAIELKFSAVLTPGTCTFELDKSTLSLGYFSLSQMTPATLTGNQPFTLTVKDCTGTDPALTPVVNITGEGTDLASKWVFRTSGSTSSNVGIMLVKTDMPPDYSSAAVKDADSFPLAGMGAIPTDQTHTFYAGLTCGDAATCAKATVGSVTARIMFKLDYH